MTAPVTRPVAGLFGGRWGAPLIEAAGRERDRRARLYPNAIAAQRMTESDGTADYQAWVAISDWLALGTLPPWFNTANHNGTVIDWPLLEAAADKALQAIDAKLERERSGDDAVAIADLEMRRVHLFAIHHAVQRMRRWVDEVNAGLHGPVDTRAAA